MAIRCLHCGAHNTDGADWCNQCYASLIAPTEPASAMLEPATPAESAPPQTDQASEQPEPKWSCPVCDTVNPISEDRCLTCGTTMIAAFAPPPDQLDVATIRRWAVVPGGGHAKAGAGPTGMAVFLVVLMALGFSIPLVNAAKTRVMGILMLVVALTVWAVSVQDVLRRLRTGSPWMLQPRVISGIAGVIITLLIVAVLLAVNTTQS